jgi:cell wall assembly regulator SMI1
MVSMLHFVPGEEAYEAVAALRDVLAPGSYLVISHPVTEAIDAHTADRVKAVYQQTTTPGGPRSRAEVQRFFDGFAMVPPGLVWIPQWHPEDGAGDGEPLVHGPGRVGMVAGVGHKMG